MDEVEGAFVDALLRPLAGNDGPSGPALGADNEFLELTKAAEGKPETQFAPGVPPNWRDVEQRAAALLERSRDLQAAVLWTRGAVNQRGLVPLSQGLRLLRGLLENAWDSVHPLPDDGDPYERFNALAVLASGDGVVGDLRRSALFNLPGLGDLRGRDVEVALRLLPARGSEEPRSREQLARMFADAARATPALRSASRDALAHLRAISVAVADHGTPETPPPDLKPLQRVLEGIEALMPADGVAGAVGDGGPDPAPATTSAEVRGDARLTGVNSRAEAVRAIEMVCDFLERTEPTSPAPLFLRRASRMINQSFLQLVKELAPEALNDVARVVGVNPDTVTLEDKS